MPNALPKSGKAAACQSQCLGPFERAADPCIEQFVATQVAMFLKEIGLKLPLMFQGVDFQNAARQIKKFFESDSEAFWRRPGQPELPHIRPNEDWLLPPVDPTEFVDLLERVQVPKSETCRVERNLMWLGDLLHLSQVERKLLLWVQLLLLLLKGRRGWLVGQRVCALREGRQGCLHCTDRGQRVVGGGWVRWCLKVISKYHIEI